MENKRTISIAYDGKVKVEPDTMIINIINYSIDKDYDKAVQNNTKASKKIEEAIKKLGYKSSDLKTKSYNTSKKEDEARDKKGNWITTFLGYECIHEMEFILDFNSDELKRVLASLYSIEGVEVEIDFAVKNTEEARKKLYEEITTNAERKVRCICEASGNKLGKLQRAECNIDESRYRYRFNMSVGKEERRCYMKDYAKEENMPNFYPRDVVIKDTVHFTWEIE